jgi:hypothetical protein
MFVMKYSYKVLFFLLIVLLFSISCNTRLSRKYLVTEGYVIKKFDFPNYEPELDVCMVKQGNNENERGDILLIRSAFMDMLNCFIPKDSLTQKPMGYVLLMKGFISEKKVINYEDIKSITIFNFNKDNSFSTPIYLKNIKTGKFEKILQDKNIPDIYGNDIIVNDTVYYTKLKNSKYSYFKITDADDKQLNEHKPSASKRFCKAFKGNYKSIQFELLQEQPSLEILYAQADSCQKCAMLVKYDIYKELINELFPGNGWDIFEMPYFSCIYLKGIVSNKKIIKKKDIIGITTYTYKDHHLYHRLYLHDNNTKEFNEIKEMYCQVDTIDNIQLKLTIKNLVPCLKDSLCSYLMVGKGVFLNENIHFEKNEFMEKFYYYNSLKE